jgi:hypothetical protein
MSDSGYPMVLNDNANVSFVGYSSMARVYEETIWEKRGAATETFARVDMPIRRDSNDYFVPLYVGYYSSLTRTVEHRDAVERSAVIGPRDMASAVDVFDLQGRAIKIDPRVALFTEVTGLLPHGVWIVRRARRAPSRRCVAR